MTGSIPLAWKLEVGPAFSMFYNLLLDMNTDLGWDLVTLRKDSYTVSNVQS